MEAKQTLERAIRFLTQAYTHKKYKRSGQCALACTSTLHTVELLEMILEYLSTAELARNKRVCRQWQQVIISSPQLQRNLFLRARQRHECVNWDWEPENQDWVATLPVNQGKTVRRRDPNCLPVIALHPALHAKIRYADYPARVSYFFIRTTLKHLLACAHASLSDAFVTQPPCKALNIHLVGFSEAIWRLIESEEGCAGVMMSQVAEAAASYLKHRVSAPEARIPRKGTVLIWLADCVEENMLCVARARGESVSQHGEWRLEGGSLPQRWTRIAWWRRLLKAMWRRLFRAG